MQILAARIEWFIDPTDWTTVNDTSRRIPGYYQILQDLGYTPTDDETSHLDQLIAAITEADSDENEEDEEKQPMTREQLDKLAQLLTDTAQTASTIELRALAGGRADDGIVALAAGLRANCTSCLVMVDGLMQEVVRCE